MTEKENYARIFRTTSVLGGSQVLIMIIGLAKVKMVAMLLGPNGLGLLSVLQSIATLGSTITVSVFRPLELER